MITPDTVRFLLVGAGPHAKRTYIPHLQEFAKKGQAVLLAIVDVEGNEEFVTAHQQQVCPTVELMFVPSFTLEMPPTAKQRLKQLVTRLEVSVIIISTEPLAHRAYGLWAISEGLNVIMDKPISTRPGCCTSFEAAYGIAQDYNDLVTAYRHLQQHRKTFFLINSHRRYHPGVLCALEMVREVQQKTGCSVTNIISTHCDGMWRMPPEIVEQKYHTFSNGYGKVSHSGYHFLDCCYQFLKWGWTENKRPDNMEVVSSFLLPNGFLTALNGNNYRQLFGEEYDQRCKYTDEELRKLMMDMGELDASVQVTFSRDGDAIALAQINLQHNGFSRRSWVKPGLDLYKGIGRVRHEMHEIKSGPMQTVVIDSRQANDKHDRSKPSNAKLGSDNHYEVHVFRNSELLGEQQPLRSFNVDDLDQRHNIDKRGLYGENIKRGILEEAISFVGGGKSMEQLTSNLPDHSVPAHMMSAVYVSHIRRSSGLNPVVSLAMSYTGKTAYFSTFSLSILGDLFW